VTEGRPGNEGAVTAKVFRDAGIPCKIILDCAVGTIMEQVDMCLCGAEGVMENGGIVNKTGTYQMAIVAKAMKKPLYVAVESYKFARMYPLTQRDIYDLCAHDEVSLRLRLRLRSIIYIQYIYMYCDIYKFRYHNTQQSNHTK